MTTVSISALKSSPAKILDQAQDYPVAVAKRTQIKAYLIGSKLYEKLIAYLENQSDKKVIESTNFRQGKNFEIVAKELGL